MTFRERLAVSSDPVAGSRELAMRLAYLTDHNITVVWAGSLADAAYLIARYRPGTQA